MTPDHRLAALAATLLLCACSTGGTTSGTAANAPAAVSTFWPEGVPTPPPLLGAPEVGPSETGADLLQVAYEHPHLIFTLKGAPAGTYSVIYAVGSTRHKHDKLQIESVDPDSSFKAKLEYDRLYPGEWVARAFTRAAADPVDTRKIQVPSQAP